jgi:hypothetical protein
MGEDMHNTQPTSLSSEELLRFSEGMLRQDLPLPRSWALELVKRFDSEYGRGHEDALDGGSRDAYDQGYQDALDARKPSYICDECGSEN